MRDAAQPQALSTFELVGIVAATSGLTALSIDMMLPALPQIGREYELANDNDRQLVVLAFVGLFGIAQLAYGPLADAFGRKRVLVVSLCLYIFGSMLCVLAPSFELLLAARALQGAGGAAMRVIATAVVRDLTEGRRMAQVMSMAMTVFMIVPIIAPGIGQLVLFVAPWRWIFGVLLIYALLVLAWTLVRLPETLRPENRTPFQLVPIARAFRAVLRERQTLGYMIASTFMTACLFGYITASEQLFVDVFGLGVMFPIAFGSVALAISVGTFVNARIVMRLGMRRISHIAVLCMTATATLLALLSASGFETFWVFLALVALTMTMFGLIAGNFSALAMAPAGRIAGSAAAVFGAVTSTGGAIAGGLIARAFDGTATPFAIGLALSGAFAFLAVCWTERGRLFSA